MYLSKTYHLIQDHLDHLKNVPIKNISLDLDHLDHLKNVQIKNISLDPGPLRPLQKFA
jgi:hypothetical protein